MHHSRNSLVPFLFHGDTLKVFHDEKAVWVAVRPVCRALGLDAKSQQRKLRRVPWAREKTIILPDPTGQLRHTFMVDLYSVPP